MKTLFFLATILIVFSPMTADAARLHTIGFENQTAGAPATITAGEEFTSTGCGGTHCDIVSTPVHSGSFAYANSTTVAAFTWIGNVFRADGSTGKAYARCYFRYNVLTATNPIEMCSFWDSVAVDRRATVVITSGGVGQLLQDNNAQIGSNSSALSADTWYCVQIVAEGTNAGTEHLSASIEETECTASPSAFATTETATVGDFNAIYIGTPNASANFTAYWDDLAVNDETATKGSTQTSYPGPEKLVYLRPTASGDTAADTGTFADVDEVDADDGTTEIHLDNTTSIACYNITDTTGLIDSYDTIKIIDMGVRLQEETSAVTSYQFGFKSQASGLVASSTAQDAGDTTYRTNQTGTTAMTNRMATTTDPQDNNALTTTDLDNGQICIASLDADNLDASTLWLAVGYTDGTAPAVGGVKNSVIFFDSD